MALTVICANRAQGKTTLLRQYVADRAEAGRTVGGIASPAAFANGQRIGYDLEDIRRGIRRPLAREVTAADETPTIGVYRFDEAAIAEGNAAVSAAVQDGVDVIAIDEIGPLELEGRGWAPALAFALQTCNSAQELVIAVRTSLVDALPSHFPAPAWASARRISPPGRPPDQVPDTGYKRAPRDTARRPGE
jgi:nucleoside-triphosphatase